MSKALVESNEFTASVVVPEDGDPRTAASVEMPFQALANRTTNLKERVDMLDAFAAYRITASGQPPFANATLTEIAQSGGFSNTTNTITVPAKPGLYLATLSVSCTFDGAEGPHYLGLNLRGPNSLTLNPIEAVGQRPSSTVTDVVTASNTGVVTYVDPSELPLRVEVWALDAAFEAVDGNITVQSGCLVLRRVA